MKKEKMNLKKLRYKVVFFGTPEFVNPVLKALEENFDVVKSVRNPQEWNKKTINELRNLNADFFVVASFGQILPKEVLEIPKIAAINIHPSLLPKYRGPSPIQTAIINGDTTSGVTIIKMDEKMDHGPIVDQFEAEIKPTDTFETLSKRLFGICTSALLRVLTRPDSWKLKTQNETDATYTKLLSREDGFVDLSNENSFKIKNLKLKIRAFFPWPGVWTRFEIINHKSLIIKLLPQEKIQVEGKNPMNYKDLINGYPNGKELLEKLNLL